jgi:rubredoxin
MKKELSPKLKKTTKCPKSVSGKHRFIQTEIVDWSKFKCEYCGRIYDP